MALLEKMIIQTNEGRGESVCAVSGGINWYSFVHRLVSRLTLLPLFSVLEGERERERERERGGGGGVATERIWLEQVKESGKKRS